MVPSEYTSSSQRIRSGLSPCSISTYSEIVGAIGPDCLPQKEKHSHRSEFGVLGHPYTPMDNGCYEGVVPMQNFRTSLSISHSPEAMQPGSDIEEKLRASKPSYGDVSHPGRAVAITQAHTTSEHSLTFRLPVKGSNAICTSTAVPKPQIFIAETEARSNHQTEHSGPTNALLVGTAGPGCFLPRANYSPFSSVESHFSGHSSSTVSHELQYIPLPDHHIQRGGNIGYSASSTYKDLLATPASHLANIIWAGKYPYTLSGARAGATNASETPPELTLSAVHNQTSGFRKSYNDGKDHTVCNKAWDGIGPVNPRLGGYAMERTTPGRILGLPPDAICIVDNTGDCLYCTTKNIQSPIEHAWGHIVNELRPRRRYSYEEGRVDILNSPERRKIAQEYEDTRIDLCCPRCGDKFSRRDATKRHLSEACPSEGHDEAKVREWRIQVDQMVERIELDCAMMMRRLGFRAYAKREDVTY